MQNNHTIYNLKNRSFSAIESAYDNESWGLFVYRQDSADRIYRSEQGDRMQTPIESPFSTHPPPTPPFYHPRLGKAPYRIHLLSAFRIRTHFLTYPVYVWWIIEDRVCAFFMVSCFAVRTHCGKLAPLISNLFLSGSNPGGH